MSKKNYKRVENRVKNNFKKLVYMAIKDVCPKLKMDDITVSQEEEEGVIRFGFTVPSKATKECTVSEEELDERFAKLCKMCDGIIKAAYDARAKCDFSKEDDDEEEVIEIVDDEEDDEVSEDDLDDLEILLHAVSNLMKRNEISVITSHGVTATTEGSALDSRRKHWQDVLQKRRNRLKRLKEIKAPQAIQNMERKMIAEAKKKLRNLGDASK